MCFDRVKYWYKWDVKHFKHVHFCPLPSSRKRVRTATYTHHRQTFTCLYPFLKEIRTKEVDKGDGLKTTGVKHVFHWSITFMNNTLY